MMFENCFVQNRQPFWPNTYQHVFGQYFCPPSYPLSPPVLPVPECPNQLSDCYYFHQQVPTEKPSQKFTSFSIDAILSSNKKSEQKSVEKMQFDQRFTDFEMREHIPEDLFDSYDPNFLEEAACKVEPNAEKKYECYICKKGYTRKHQLKIHFRIHTKNKPLSCQFCGKTFSDKSNLNKHKKTHAFNFAANMIGHPTE